MKRKSKIVIRRKSGSGFKSCSKPQLKPAPTPVTQPQAAPGTPVTVRNDNELAYMFPQ